MPKISAARLAIIFKTFSGVCRRFENASITFARSRALNLSIHVFSRKSLCADSKMSFALSFVATSGMPNEKAHRIIENDRASVLFLKYDDDEEDALLKCVFEKSSNIDLIPVSS